MQGITWAAFGGDSKNNRPVFRGIDFSWTQDRLAFVGADGYHMHIHEITCGPTPQPINVHVSLVHLVAWVKSQKPIGETEFVMTPSHISLGDQTFQGNDMQYPDYQSITPRHSDCQLKYKAAELESALKFVNVLAKYSANTVLVEQNSFSSVAQDLGDSVVKIENYAAGYFKPYAINGHYMWQAVNGLAKARGTKKQAWGFEAKFVTVESSGPHDPLTLYGDQRATYAVIMPMATGR